MRMTVLCFLIKRKQRIRSGAIHCHHVLAWTQRVELIDEQVLVKVGVGFVFAVTSAFVGRGCRTRSTLLDIARPWPGSVCACRDRILRDDHCRNLVLLQRTSDGMDDQHILWDPRAVAGVQAARPDPAATRQPDIGR